ncbi:MAG: 30S ribosomal protein S4 [Candidatus Aenigmarchaeota archaeon]|nr:30S ribosomal protein S4 [Candidatus Aenigmarchaeota archaeon]
MRRIRKKFKKPRSPWNITKIRDERKLLNEYGLRRKKEMLIAQEVLRRYRQRARELIAKKDKEKERILIEKMSKMGLLNKKESTLDDILAVNIINVLDRRLQTLVFRKGIAKTPLQARQLIVHGHISVAGKRTRFPSYTVPVEEERKISLRMPAKTAKVQPIEETSIEGVKRHLPAKSE